MTEVHTHHFRPPEDIHPSYAPKTPKGGKGSLKLRMNLLEGSNQVSNVAVRDISKKQSLWHRVSERIYRRWAPIDIEGYGPMAVNINSLVKRTRFERSDILKMDRQQLTAALNKLQGEEKDRGAVCWHIGQPLGGIFVPLWQVGFGGVKANWGRLVESNDSQDVYQGVRKTANGLEPIVVIDLQSIEGHIGPANRAFTKKHGQDAKQFRDSIFIMPRDTWLQESGKQASKQNALRSSQ
jgi:hypothetical protein